MLSGGSAMMSHALNTLKKNAWPLAKVAVATGIPLAVGMHFVFGGAPPEHVLSQLPGGVEANLGLLRASDDVVAPLVALRQAVQTPRAADRFCSLVTAVGDLAHDEVLVFEASAAAHGATTKEETLKALAHPALSLVAVDLMAQHRVLIATCLDLFCQGCMMPTIDTAMQSRRVDLKDEYLLRKHIALGIPTPLDRRWRSAMLSLIMYTKMCLDNTLSLVEGVEELRSFHDGRLGGWKASKHRSLAHDLHNGPGAAEWHERMKTFSNTAFASQDVMQTQDMVNQCFRDQQRRFSWRRRQARKKDKTPRRGKKKKKKKEAHLRGSRSGSRSRSRSRGSRSGSGSGSGSSRRRAHGGGGGGGFDAIMRRQVRS